MPLTQMTHEMYKSAEGLGYGRDDNSGVMQVVEHLAGIKARVDEDD